MGEGKGDISAGKGKSVTDNAKGVSTPTSFSLLGTREEAIFLVSLQLPGAMCVLTYGLWTEMIHTKLIL